MLRWPRLTGRTVFNNSIAARRVAGEHQLTIIYSIDCNAKQPVRENLAGTHSIELFEWLSRLDVRAIADEGFYFLECDFQTLKSF